MPKIGTRGKDSLPRCRSLITLRLVAPIMALSLISLPCHWFLTRVLNLCVYAAEIVVSLSSSVSFSLGLSISLPSLSICALSPFLSIALSVVCLSSPLSLCSFFILSSHAPPFIHTGSWRVNLQFRRKEGGEDFVPHISPLLRIFCWESHFVLICCRWRGGRCLREKGS